MDYCSTCRRHLNGALVCPGCGAYAPDIAPNATADSAAPFAPGPAADPASDDGFAAHPAPSFTPPGTATPPFAWEPTPGPAEAAPAAGDARFAGAGDSIPGTATGAMSAGAADGAAATADASDGWQRPGRAARRRQRARWKKTQRRALVATAVALVGGGLTVASLDRHTAAPAQAAPAPGAPHTDSLGRQPAGHTGTATGDADLGPASPTSPARPSTRHTHQPATTAAAPQDTATAQGVHPYSAAPHTTAAVPAPAAARPSAPAPRSGGSGSSVTSSGSSSGSGDDRSPGTTTQQTSQPAGSDGSGSGSGTAQTGPTTTAPSQTSPSSTSSSQQLCLLVVCLG
ncbi:hypothetical protein GCM10014715_18980 [Streptomyces spiralis]|uniref:Uncharacterized protein n=1 Tax=Streptomyces spiralis TaxID=66376 RepID=A0A918ZS44_9ACTN|nr:hypothetical protein [Streptomyces spiralis]GHE65549.1 hypothetical protein GCM10014715_18980 [Streptomyces spiralis]